MARDVGSQSACCAGRSGEGGRTGRGDALYEKSDASTSSQTTRARADISNKKGLDIGSITFDKSFATSFTLYIPSTSPHTGEITIAPPMKYVIAFPRSMIFMSCAGSKSCGAGLAYAFALYFLASRRVSYETLGTDLNASSFSVSSP